MTDLNSHVRARLRELSSQFDALERQLFDPAVLSDHQKMRDLSIKRAALAGLVEQFRGLESLDREIEEHQKIVADASDSELTEIAKTELPQMREKQEQTVRGLANEMVTAEDRAVGSVVLEVRAGTGGAEAALWAGDLFEMYQRYATIRGWEWSTLELSAGEQGGLRQGVAGVRGQGVWQGLGYESGVHSVKRVPATETQGRVHTSTATVAVLPEPEQVQMEIPDSDVKIDVTTAQGPGGQNVNKVATAVKMVHVPTGIEVRMQESKSQQQNRAKAWLLLRTRVYDHYQRQKDAQRAQARSKMIGSGDRSERIRTYRYKENVVVDHRLERSFPLAKALEGRLDDIVAALAERDLAQRLADL